MHTGLDSYKMQTKKHGNRDGGLDDPKQKMGSLEIVRCRGAYPGPFAGILQIKLKCARGCAGGLVFCSLRLLGGGVLIQPLA
jgi:hypothetical protein